MYVYISETCQQEAKLYQIEQKLEELANWVKKGSRPDFFKLFEIFQHPYYVRKSIGCRDGRGKRCQGVTHNSTNKYLTPRVQPTRSGRLE